MIKNFIPGLLIVSGLVSCSTMKPLNFTSNKQVSSTSGVSNLPASSSGKKTDVRFLDDIAVDAEAGPSKRTALPEKQLKGDARVSDEKIPLRSYSLEKATDLQLKYAVLLNTEVEELQDNQLLPYVDEWYGTKYRYGGSTKSGIDCSAFTQAIYLAAFAVSLPRTARDQFRTARIVSATEMRTGDLVFFNTTGGISHVGIYLQNNKFVHASSAYGVTISDLFDPYYLRRFIGVGRIEKPEVKNR